MTDALTAALIELHDAVARRLHESPTLRLMAGTRIIHALARVRALTIKATP